MGSTWGRTERAAWWGTARTSWHSEDGGGCKGSEEEDECGCNMHDESELITLVGVGVKAIVVLFVGMNELMFDVLILDVHGRERTLIHVLS